MSACLQKENHNKLAFLSLCSLYSHSWNLLLTAFVWQHLHFVLQEENNLLQLKSTLIQCTNFQLHMELCALNSYIRFQSLSLAHDFWRNCNNSCPVCHAIQWNSEHLINSLSASCMDIFWIDVAVRLVVELLQSTHDDDCTSLFLRAVHNFHKFFRSSLEAWI